MNMKFGKLSNGQIEYAPETLAVNGAIKVNPTDESYLAAGWKRVVNNPPEPEPGKDVMMSAWTEDETTLTCVYKQVPHTEPDVPTADGGATSGGTSAEPGKRVFSKLKIVAALKAADKWVLVKTWLEEKSYYDYYLAAQNFAEDYPLFQEGLAALKRYANLSDEAVETILAQCIAD